VRKLGRMGEHGLMLGLLGWGIGAGLSMETEEQIEISTGCPFEFES
jgi:hypothetical protein